MKPIADKPYQVAILDDVPSTLKLVERIFQRAFHCGTQCFDSSQAILDASQDPDALPDLYMLDIRMPEISGIDVCKQLKQNTNTCDIPVIFFSARNDPRTRLSALNAGGVDFIDKPFYPEEMVARVKAHLELYRSHRQLSLQLAEKQALLRVLCHDLKNPISATYSLLDFMREVEGVASESSQLALSACTSALELIDHVRQYRNLSDSRTPLRTQRVNVSEAIEESIQIIQSTADAKQVTIKRQVTPNLLIEINRVVLVHNLMNNLLTNAIKFSHPQSTITIVAQKIDQHGTPQCQIKVSDNGIGIPSEILRHLFDAEKSGSRPGTSGEIGTGMGMPLAKLYVDRSGGTIEIQSSPEEPSGTTISLLFPLLQTKKNS